MRKYTRFSLICVLLLSSTAPVWARDAVFVVRHAERADGGTAVPPKMGSDPDLSEAGKARAQALAAALKDAGITAIFTTEFKRTRQTAEPLAKALGLTPTVVSARETSALIEKLKSSASNVLVIGHSNTVGDTIAGLGVQEAVKVGDNDYDNLFIVVRGEKPTLLQLHYR